MTVRIMVGDVLDKLAELPDESVHCVITSPPYWGLRDYGNADWEGGDVDCDHKRSQGDISSSNVAHNHNTNHAQEPWPNSICGRCGATKQEKGIGLEPTFDEHVETLVRVFREVWRVLRKDGTLWLNYGDAYCGGGRGGGGQKQDSNVGSVKVPSPIPSGLKPKDLMMMPARVAIALQQPFLKCCGCGHVAHEMKWGRFPDGRMICPVCIESKGTTIERNGWWVRKGIIWHKSNTMPESATDRPTSAHEFLFQMSKSARYYYDRVAVRTESQPDSDARLDRAIKGYAPPRPGIFDEKPQMARPNKRKSIPSSWATADGYQNQDPRYPKRDKKSGHGPQHEGFNDRWNSSPQQAGANLRDVWKFPTSSFADAHFATFPPALVETPIKAGTSEKGCCSVCGAPWVRTIEKSDAPHDPASNDSKFKDEPKAKAQRLNILSKTCRDRGEKYISSVTTTGWEPTCEHDGEPVPCTVLDPFGGSGTAGLVADRLNRDAILIELNPEYAEMARKRIRNDAPLFTEVI